MRGVRVDAALREDDRERARRRARERHGRREVVEVQEPPERADLPPEEDL